MDRRSRCARLTRSMEDVAMGGLLTYSDPLVAVLVATTFALVAVALTGVAAHGPLGRRTRTAKPGRLKKARPSSVHGNRGSWPPSHTLQPRPSTRSKIVPDSGRFDFPKPAAASRPASATNSEPRAELRLRSRRAAAAPRVPKPGSDEGCRYGAVRRFAP